ncbi:amino-acid N-acetyltransferase [Ranunculus cassubicifolius]
MFTPMSRFSTEGNENHSIASNLEGSLLISRKIFPYFMLVALEAGGPIRAFILLLSSPVLWLLEWLCFESVSLQVMIFISFGGLKFSDIKTVANSVLPRFLLGDIRSDAYKVFSSCGGKKYVVTSMPRIMVESFLQDFLNVHHVLGTELRFVGEYCLGIIAKKEEITDVKQVDIGLGDAFDHHPYPKPVIFHDGRLVARPTLIDSIAVIMWIPLGILLAVLRLLIGKILPHKLGIMVAAATGLKIRAKLSPDTCSGGTGTNILYVCSHRTLIDPVMVSTTLQKSVTAVTYSVSRISELLSPIRTVRLTRDRSKDGEAMQGLLKQGDLVVCPEGTTCREPYLLRFSPLFAEIADVIVPVAVEAKSSMFYGTSVRGYKGLDSFFFLMNPNPEYYLEFLKKLSGVRVCGGSSYEFANSMQKLIGTALGFECTSLTRKDKYMALAGTDGREIGR